MHRIQPVPRAPARGPPVHAAQHRNNRSPPNKMRVEPLPERPLTGGLDMRTAVAAIILLSSSLGPSFAQDQGKAPAPSQPQTVPVQPERSPQQSQQSRAEDRDRSEDRQVGRDWRTRPSDSEDMGQMGQNDAGRTGDRTGRDPNADKRTVGRDWRTHPYDDRADRDGYGRGSYAEDRPLRRVKICFEYENGDEYCRYR